MRSFLVIGAVILSMSSCGLQERLKSATNDNRSSAGSAKPNIPSPDAESARMTAAQQAIADAGTETEWEDQELSWKLPAGWKKIKVVPRLFNYGSADNAFIIASVFEVPDTYAAEDSLKSTYEGAKGKVESGEYETARMLEIDGVRGVEWIEKMPAEKDDPRRHQWIAFRKHEGKNQQLNVILSTSGDNFDKHRDEFAAVMYSIKIPKDPN